MRLEYIDEDGAPEDRPSIPRLITMAMARSTDHNPPAPGTVAVDITLDATALNEALERVRERMREFGEAIGPALARMADNARAAFGPLNEALYRTFSRITYLTPDGPPPPPIVDARTALIALNWAEWTEVVNHPDKPTRRHAKARYLEVRRHLPPEYRRRIKSVPVNQFGSLT